MEHVLLAIASLSAAGFAAWALALRARARDARRRVAPAEAAPEGESGRLQELNRALLEIARRGAISDKGVQASLGEITETAARSLDVGRVGVWIFDEQRKAIRCIHQYDARNGGHSQPEVVLARSDAPSYFAAIRESRIVDAEDARTDPRTREIQEYLDDTGVGALVDAPIRIAGELKGVVCHEHQGTARVWLSQEKQFAASVGDLVSVVLEAAEHRKTEAELAEARRRTLQILDTITDAFFHLDPEARFTYLNPRAREWVRNMGRDPDQLLGRGIWDAFQLEPGLEGRRRLEQAMVTKEAVHHTHFSSMLGRWIELHAYPSDDGLAAYVRDVTEQKQAEEALRDSEQRFRTVVESLGEGLVITDMDARILYMNPRLTELTGYELDEVLGRGTVDVFVPQEHHDEARAHIEARRNGVSDRYELPVERKDGSLIWTEVQGSPLRGPSGEVIGIIAAVTDVTERKRAEGALRESEERYRTLFESDVAGNYVIGADGIIRNCNDAFARIFGFDSAEQAIGVQVVPRLETAETREAFLKEIREHGSLRLRETEARRLDGSPVFVTENVRGVFDGEGELLEVRGHIIDVTERRELEEQLRHAQKMEAVGRLAGGIAHDFNNLLTAVAGHADLLLLDARTPDFVRDDLDEIRHAAERATSLTEQLLAFSRKQVLRSSVLDLGRVVEGVREILERLLREDIELRFDLGSVDPVRTDPNQVEQMLLNLAVNARDAMPDGGRIDVRTRNVVVGERPAGRNPEVEPGPYVMLEFADTGAGMPEEIVERIFEPFFTTKETGKGTGLGLAMVYGFVHQTGGHVEVESREGEGTRFLIYLPSAADEMQSGTGPASLIGTETILVVDGEDSVRSLISRVLDRSGYTVLVADHPRKALIHAEQWPGKVDLLLTDIVMPEMDGQALARGVLELRPKARILYVSAHTDLELEQEGPAGARGRFLAKPFTPDELLRKIRDVLDGRAPSQRDEGGRR